MRKNIIETVQELKSIVGEVYSPNELREIIYRIFDSLIGYSRLDVELKGDTLLESEIYSTVVKMAHRLAEEEPIQYILNEGHFYGMELKVAPGVLIPRPETEELVQWIITDYKQEQTTVKLPSILDIGTGSGAIAIALASNIEGSRVTAYDISPEAIAIAEDNAKTQEVDVDIEQVDILKWRDSNQLSGELRDGRYNIIVSNPPYITDREKLEIRDNVLKYEPHLALFVEDSDPLIFYREIAQYAKEALLDNGALYFEINQYFGAETVALLKELGYSSVELRSDLSGNSRVIKAKI